MKLTKSCGPQSADAWPTSHREQYYVSRQRNPLQTLNSAKTPHSSPPGPSFDTSKAKHNVPVYAGYSFIGSKPSCFSNSELVHSHTPPISACPANRFPFAVTDTGCQFWKPTFAPSRLVKSSWCEEELPRCEEGVDGGLSSTPSLTRWLFLSVNITC